MAHNRNANASFDAGRNKNFKNLNKPKNFKLTMVKLLKYLKPYYFKIVFSGFFAIINALLAILGPFMLGLITSEVGYAVKEAREIGSLSFAGFQISILVMILLIIGNYVLQAMFGFLQQIFLANVTQSMSYRMRMDLSYKINKLPLSFFDSRPFGDILSRLTSDVDTISQTLSQSLSEIFRAIAMVVGLTVVMFILSWQLAAIVFVSIVLATLSAFIFVSKSQKYFKAQASIYGNLSGTIEEDFSGQAIIKVYNHSKKSHDKFSEINSDLKETSRKSQFISGIMMPVQFFVSNLSYIAVCYVGALLVIDNVIGIGIIQTFLFYMRIVNQPIQQIASISNVLQSTAASSERIFEILEEEEESFESNDLVVPSKVKGLVEFKDVHFSYTKGNEIIKGLSAVISPGDTVAIVGPTGAGKTTIVNLLMRFYELDSGSILIDGINIKDMSRRTVRSLFSMVLQDTWLFEGTVKENISYGSKNSTKEEIISAAKKAQTHFFIETLQNGYDFLLDENGTNISQGQRQLITISRAMLSKRPMLILDEATSSVDTRTEILIQKAMNNLMEKRTSFVIAHRLSTIKDAKVIFVMKDGNIVEFGNHDELIEKNGFYATLYNSQFEE
ncbi:MAG: ABC transporter ATP-binding protein/permease [Acholeplasmatales bacterium]|jgi:ATP-binding cassette subfamily B protein|nr:ABC transporter ATP-binding protein/permease [Acholeplasmatales bacterium]